MRTLLDSLIETLRHTVVARDGASPSFHRLQATEPLDTVMTSAIWATGTSFRIARRASEEDPIRLPG